MHILIAPNAFKHSLPATEAADAISRGLVASRLSCTYECFPIGDGGDGTAELISKKLGGTFITSPVADPFKREIQATFGWIEQTKTAVVEMANAAGLRLLQAGEADPLQATSFGTGQQIKAALNKGAKKIIIGMGGSATVDGGAGILQALGVQFLNEQGDELLNLPLQLNELAHLDTRHLDPRILNTDVVVLCDVKNLLLGVKGSATVFGPQKGATPAMVQQLEKGLEKFAAVALAQTNKNMATVPHGGTAGGAAAGLYAFLNARLVNGIDHFLEVTGFSESLQQAQLVITGEGAIDEQTLDGKGPFGVAQQAKSSGIPVVGLAGKIPVDSSPRLHAYFDVLLSINHEATDLQTAFKNTAANLKRTAYNVGNLMECLKN